MIDEKRRFDLPVGYHRFHGKQLFNYQLNRWHSFGYARYEDMEKAGRRIGDFSDWKRVMVELAERALSEGLRMNAAFYYRAAEFYTFRDDPDKGWRDSRCPTGAPSCPPSGCGRPAYRVPAQRVAAPASRPPAHTDRAELPVRRRV